MVGGAAWVLANVTATDAKAAATSYRSLFVLRQEKGTWRVVLVQFALVE